MQPTISALAYVIVMVTASAEVTGDDQRAVHTAHQVSCAVLPYQAVRIRWTSGNRGPKPIPEVSYPEIGKNFGGVRGPSDPDFRELRTPVLIREVHLPVSVGPRKPWGQTLELQPGESVAVAEASAGEWHRSRDQPLRPNPLFPVPGKYVITQFLRLRPPFNVEIVIPVTSPQGDDKLIAEELANDPFLAIAVMSPVHVPDPDAAEGLTRILQRYPSSSYADYARFALARARVKGVGSMMVELGLDRTREQMIDVLISSAANSIGDDHQAAKDLQGWYFPGCAFRGKVADLIGQLVAVRHGPEAALREAAERLMPHVYVSEEDRAAAVQLLTQITNPDFAYRPNALILESIIHRVDKLLRLKETDQHFRSRETQRPVFWRLDDPPRVKELTEELNRLYRDSDEWIDHMSYIIRSADEWRTFRVERLSPPARKPPSSTP
jgi:hypothetical protein